MPEISIVRDSVYKSFDSNIFNPAERNVSVIIIARNEPYIRYTLQSILLQTVRPYEVIVVVDNASDISAKIAREFSDRLPIRIVLNDIRPGYGGARKKGVEIAQGDIVAFIDADIVAPPHWLERIVLDLQKAFVVAGPDIVVEVSRVEEVLRDFMSQNVSKNAAKAYSGAETYVDFAPTQNFAFRREILKVVGNFDESFDKGGEDYDFCLRLKANNYRILWDPLLYVFHLRKGGLKHILRKSWRDGRSRARVFLKHGFRAVKDAFVCFLHGFAVLSTPLTIYLVATGGLTAYSVVLLVLLVSSLAHRFYRALLLINKENRIAKAFKDSFLTYIAHTAFVVAFITEMLSRIVEKGENPYRDT